MTTGPFTAWLSEALAAVEAVAQAAEKDAGSPWRTEENYDSEQRDLVVASTPLPGFTRPVYELWTGEGLDGVYGSPRVAKFIAAFDPATVLALVEADRKLLVEHEADGRWGCYVCHDISGHEPERMSSPCPTLRIRGAFWARLCPEGYDEAWRPE